MGLFSGIKANWCKAAAAASIQSFFERQAKLGFYPSNEVTPAVMANKLVEVAWDKHLGLDKEKMYPHKMALSAASLAIGVQAMEHGGHQEMRMVLMSGLGSVLMELSTSGHQIKLDSYDIYLIQQAESFYLKQSEKNSDLLKGIF